MIRRKGEEPWEDENPITLVVMEYGTVAVRTLHRF